MSDPQQSQGNVKPKDQCEHAHDISRRQSEWFANVHVSSNSKGYLCFLRAFDPRYLKVRVQLIASRHGPRASHAYVLSLPELTEGAEHSCANQTTLHSRSF